MGVATRVYTDVNEGSASDNFYRGWYSHTDIWEIWGGDMVTMSVTQCV